MIVVGGNVRAKQEHWGSGRGSVKPGDFKFQGVTLVGALFCRHNEQLEPMINALFWHWNSLTGGHSKEKKIFRVKTRGYCESSVVFVSHVRVIKMSFTTTRNELESVDQSVGNQLIK